MDAFKEVANQVNNKFKGKSKMEEVLLAVKLCLNKVTADNLSRTKSEFYSIISKFSEVDQFKPFMSEVISMVVEKARDEENNCEVYAKLMKEALTIEVNKKDFIAKAYNNEKSPIKQEFLLSILNPIVKDTNDAEMLIDANKFKDYQTSMLKERTRKRRTGN